MDKLIYSYFKLNIAAIRQPRNVSSTKNCQELSLRNHFLALHHVSCMQILIDSKAWPLIYTITSIDSKKIVPQW